MEKLKVVLQNRNKVLLILIYCLLIVFALAKVGENGDFIGYVNAGNLVLSQGDIYSDMFNTWPPVFSIFSVPLAIINNFNFVLIRVIWMIVIFCCFFFCIKSTIELLNDKRYTYKILLTEILEKPFYLLALFLSCRPLMDNMIYMQINVVMLAACCYFIQYTSGKGSILSSLILGLSIGAKVYNILLIPVIVLFRKWKSLFYVLIGIAATFILCFAVFGIQQSLDYFNHWYLLIASVKQTIVHRNQSLIAGLIRIFSNENIAVNNAYPIMNLSYGVINYIQLAIIGVLLSFYLLLFSRFIFKANKTFVFHSFILILTMIPLLTPVSWKANYIYALPAFFLLCHAIDKKQVTTIIAITFTLSCMSLCLSNEAIIGRSAMYFLETWNILIIGELLLFISLLLQMNLFKSKNIYTSESLKAPHY